MIHLELKLAALAVDPRINDEAVLAVTQSLNVLPGKRGQLEPLAQPAASLEHLQALRVNGQPYVAIAPLELARLARAFIVTAGVIVVARRHRRRRGAVNFVRRTGRALRQHDLLLVRVRADLEILLARLRAVEVDPPVNRVVRALVDVVDVLRVVVDRLLALLLVVLVNG